MIRRVLFGTAVLALGVGVSAVALRYISPSLFHSSKHRQAVDLVHARLLVAQEEAQQEAQQEALRSREGRPVYPYSVVPGGVEDARELKWAAEHDPVVAAHYAGFDYDHARVVRLVLARTVYVSYRIGNKVYWSRHRISLKKGETVLTDGSMTARTRCGNRVEEVPQQATSSSEPPAVQYDQPAMPSLGPATTGLPAPFQSSLLSNPPGMGPTLPLSKYSPFGEGIWVPISPPPLPGVCGVGKKTTTTKRKGNPCGNGGGGGVVPEPGTWLLVASGLAAMSWMSWRRLNRGPIPE
jgi:PEP-CTERM motif